MSRFFETLWDLIAPAVKPKPPTVKLEQPAPKPAPKAPARPVPKARVRKPRKAERFEAIAREQLTRYEIRVRKWRREMTGIAWYVTYADGRMQRLIEAPRPKTEMSLAILLHEVGHHAIGFNTYKPRCLEEYHAWQYAFRAMNEHGVEITERVRKRYEASMRYAIGKARRRGIKAIPVELAGFLVGVGVG
ncbi:MAG: hypothetical protein ACOYN0_19070 [Phycisphaerales bacterium]